MMWKIYFNFVKLKPGKVLTNLLGLIDFSRDDLSLETIKSLYENDFPYLEITEEGKRKLYGIDDEASMPQQISKKKKTPTQRIKNKRSKP